MRGPPAQSTLRGGVVRRGHGGTLQLQTLSYECYVYPMEMTEKELIVESNRLWGPVRPYLARLVSDLYGRHDGCVLEIGPFSGLAFESVPQRHGHVLSYGGVPRRNLERLEG